MQHCVREIKKGEGAVELHVCCGHLVEGDFARQRSLLGRPRLRAILVTLNYNKVSQGSRGQLHSKEVFTMQCMFSLTLFCLNKVVWVFFLQHAPSFRSGQEDKACVL